MLVAEDGSVDLGFRRIFEQIDLLFRFGRHVRFKRLDILLDPRFDALKQAYAISVLPVSVFFSHCHPLLSSRSGRVSSPAGSSEARQFRYPGRNAPSSLNWLGCPFGHWYSLETSTRIWPSGASSTWARSIGRGAGPSKLTPSLS